MLSSSRSQNGSTRCLWFFSLKLSLPILSHSSALTPRQWLRDHHMPLSTLKNELFLAILSHSRQYKTSRISRLVYAGALNRVCD